ncbi:MAG TPA: leucyl/phenylalanyl-tRNA--protein transferase [Stellaceae bacterium]|jgi:leucyl/phenylalanyl-tRNA--protein transferase|nr:leucyl/phenylalanyl-tRNA--protein transferase [Stellaceae bacterium]
MIELSPDLLLRAYAAGLFPMAESAEDPDLFWIDPDPRGVLPLDRFHLPRRLKRTLRAGHYEVRIDTAFDAVMRGCAEPTEMRPKTWINDEILRLYSALYGRGYAHSVEAWREGELVGGLYGVALRGVFFGESMFSRSSDASKVALVHLVARLVKGGFRLLDTQFVTDHLRRFGAVEIPRSDYHRQLERALAVEAYFEEGLADDPISVLQSSTVTS